MTPPVGRQQKSLGEIIQNNQHRIAVVKTLSGYWQLDGEYYHLAWKCSQNMPYPDFYQAWHQHNFATRAMRKLKENPLHTNNLSNFAATTLQRKLP